MKVQRITTISALMAGLLLMACNPHTPTPITQEKDAVTQEITQPEPAASREEVSDIEMPAPMLLPVALTITGDVQNKVHDITLTIDYRHAITSESKFEITLTGDAQWLHGQQVEMLPVVDEAKRIIRRVRVEGSDFQLKAQLTLEDHGMFLTMHEIYPNRDQDKRSAAPHLPTQEAPPNTKEKGLLLEETINVRK